MRTSRTPLRHSYAWLVVWLLAGIAGGPEDLVSDRLGYGGAVAVYVVVGLLLGVLWHALYPRPFGERIRALVHVVVIGLSILAGLLVLALLGTLFGGSIGGDVSRPTPNGVIGPGVLAGLFLAGRRRVRSRDVTPAPVPR